MLLFIISLAYFILHGSVVKSSQVRKAGIGEVPLIYRGVFVEFFLNISIILYLALGAYMLFFYNWKLFILYFVLGGLFSNLIIIPVLVRIIYYPLFKLGRG